mmetsp:Transcript_2397/g.7128  ORF Transcript_2397/g.7128 Transcript_2397/m.7128 type:complete len:231 (+) Transcript_2397:194-886(+)
MAQRPAARLNFPSSHTSLPRASALAILLPAPGPAMRMSMFPETDPSTLAPAAWAAAVAVARGVVSVPVKTMLLPARPPRAARAFAFGAGAGDAARLAPALGAGEAARLGAGEAPRLAAALALALASALALALALAVAPDLPAVCISSSYFVLRALRCFAYSSAVTSKSTCVPGGMTRFADVDCTKSRWSCRMSLGPFLSSPAAGQPRALRTFSWPTVNLSFLMSWSSISL